MTNFGTKFNPRASEKNMLHPLDAATFHFVDNAKILTRNMLSFVKDVKILQTTYGKISPKHICYISFCAFDEL